LTVISPHYGNGKHGTNIGTPESHARNDGCQPSKNADRNESHASQDRDMMGKKR
jgi:hypothetical protein